METEQKEQYLIEYDRFISDYKKEQMTGEEVGEFIVKMAQFFAMKNEASVLAEIALNRVAAEVVQQSDENTGKQISVAKAELIIKATQESVDFKMAKMHVENTEQFINSLKFLQRGLLQEQNLAGGM